MFIYENVQNLNDLELSLYEYIIKSKDRVVDMTIRDLAKETHVSTTTILRLCKKLGCDGFSEFKVKFKLDMEEEKINNISQDTSELIRFLQSMENSELDIQINHIADLINKCDNVIFIGSSISGVLGQYGARLLSSIGKFSVYIDDPYFPVNSKYYKNSIVIALSVSGETRTIMEYINKFKSEGCTIVSITNKEESTISKISDINLSYYIKELKYANNNITSQIPVVYIIERIAKKLI